MQETQVQSLGQEDPMEREVETNYNILSGEIPWTEEFVGLQFVGSQRVGLDERLTLLLLSTSHTITEM